MLARQPALASKSFVRKLRVAREQPMPFPTGGWDAYSPISSMPPDRAVQLKNWFPQPSYGEVRRGYQEHATDVGVYNASVESLMAWRGASSSVMFAAAGGTIYDVTSAAAAVSSSTGWSNSRFQTVNMTTTGGHYLWVCNGVDAPKHYNGSAWAAPSITGMSASDIIQINQHKRRLWFTPVNSTKAWYLPVDSVAGAATAFELGAQFTRGGTLQAMATWTKDGGSGPDDYAVFISSEGQIALYQGTDPASSTTWALVGVFDVPAPIGRRCFIKYGADLALLTFEGLFPLSQLLALDQSAITRVALSANIANAFNIAGRLYKSNFGWEACVYPKGTRIIVNVPTAENSASSQYVMNTLTGAWCEFDNHNANTWLVFGDSLYFGANTGTVYKADVGAVDNDTQITATGQTAYTALGTPYTKRWLMCRPLVTVSGSYRPEVGISTDFQETDLLSSSATTTASTVARFDTAVFDTAVFASDTNNVSDWVGLSGIGTFGSVKFRGVTGAGDVASGAIWGVSLWGSGLWGILGTTEETVRVNGFMVTAEVGGMI